MYKKFIVFEGIDGSGKTTQAKLLQNYFISQNKNSVLKKEPTDSDIGSLIKKLLEEEISLEKKSEFNKQMMHLFIADRYNHIFNKKNGILELNRQNIITIIDRYFFSTLAYNSNNIEDFNLIKKLHKDFPLPDIIIYIRTSIETSLNRISKRVKRDVYETEEKLKIVHENYENIFKELKSNILIIDGSQSIDSIHNKIIKEL